MSKSRHRFRKISGCCFLEIKDHGDKIAFPELITQLVQNLFSLTCEPSENQHVLPGQGIDNFSQVSVSQHEVEQLGRFEVIHYEPVILPTPS
jgi:hypothetical protein